MNVDNDEVGILARLQSAFKDAPTENIEPTEKKKDGEVVRGVVTSGDARRLFVARKPCGKQLDEYMATHEALHTSGRSEPHDCINWAKRAVIQVEAIDILHTLMWQAVTEECPVLVANNASLRAGWEIVSVGEWIEEPVLENNENLGLSFIPRLKSILESEIDASTPCGDLSDLEEGEEVIGVVEDNRIRALSLFQIALIEDAKKIIPEDIGTKGPKAFGDFSLNELQRIIHVMDHFKGLKETVNKIMFRAIRDSLPAAENISIGLRKNDQVVKTRDKSDSGISFVITPTGPALSIPLSSLFR